MRLLTLILTLALWLAAAAPGGAAGPYEVRFPTLKTGLDTQAVTVVGSPQHYIIRKGDDLLELARRYGLGYNDLGVLHRDWDPFLPPAGAQVLIPTL